MKKKSEQFLFEKLNECRCAYFEIPNEMKLKEETLKYLKKYEIFLKFSLKD